MLKIVNGVGALTTRSGHEPHAPPAEASLA